MFGPLVTGYPANHFKEPRLSSSIKDGQYGAIMFKITSYDTYKYSDSIRLYYIKDVSTIVQIGSKEIG